MASGYLLLPRRPLQCHLALQQQQHLLLGSGLFGCHSHRQLDHWARGYMQLHRQLQQPEVQLCLGTKADLVHLLIRQLLLLQHQTGLPLLGHRMQ